MSSFSNREKGPFGGRSEVGRAATVTMGSEGTCSASKTVSLVPEGLGLQLKAVSNQGHCVGWSGGQNF